MTPSEITKLAAPDVGRELYSGRQANIYNDLRSMEGDRVFSDIHMVMAKFPYETPSHGNSVWYMRQATDENPDPDVGMVRISIEITYNVHFPRPTGRRQMAKAPESWDGIAPRMPGDVHSETESGSGSEDEAEALTKEGISERVPTVKKAPPAPEKPEVPAAGRPGGGAGRGRQPGRALPPLVTKGPKGMKT